MKKAEDAKVYLTLPATWDEVEEKEKQTGKQFHHSGVIPVTKDSFQIATLTCSTKLTQNGTAGHTPIFSVHQSFNSLMIKRCSVTSLL